MADRHLFGSVDAPAAGLNIRVQLAAMDLALIGGFKHGAVSLEIDGAGALTEVGLVSADITPSGKLTLRGGGVSKFGDTTGYFSFNAGALSTQTVTTIDLDCSGTLQINSTGGVISIGNDVKNFNINIGTGGERDIQIGSNTANTKIDIDAGVGGGVSLEADQGPISLTTTTSGDMSWTSAGDTIIDAVDEIEINSSAGHIYIGNDANAQPIGIGTGAADRVITVGNATGATAVNILSGTAGINLSDTVAQVDLDGIGALSTRAITTMDLDCSGALQINSTGAAISIGNDANAFAINIGTGAAARAITVGNATGATSLGLTAGTGDITFTAHGCATPLTYNDAAETDLDASFAATSMVGAFNELKAGPIWMNGIVVNANAYTVNAGDEYAILHVTYTATGACAITIQTAWIAIDYNTIYVKDTGRNSFANHITIVGQANEPFEGDPAGGIMKSDGAGWWIQAYNGNLYML